uniref:Uncharacterized protein n=1 Tax=Oryza brachyantha TaxID=4533 RepID=J3MZ76_ORYBR
MHQRSGKQVSGTIVLVKFCTGRGRIRFLGSALRDCLLFVNDGSSSPSIGRGSSSATSYAPGRSWCFQSSSKQPSVQQDHAASRNATRFCILKLSSLNSQLIKVSHHVPPFMPPNNFYDKNAIALTSLFDCLICLFQY